MAFMDAEEAIANRPLSELEQRELPDAQLVTGQKWDLLIVTVLHLPGGILQLYSNAGWEFLQMTNGYLNRNEVWRDMGGWVVIMRRPAQPKPSRQRNRRP